VKSFRLLRVLFSVVFLFAALAAVPLRAGEVVNRILVHVNSRIITQSQFDARIDQTVRESGPPPNAAKGEEMKKSVMEELVNEALLEDRAKELDLVTSDAEIEDQIKRLKEQNNVTTDEDFAKGLAQSGLTIDRLRDQLRRTVTLQRVVGREVNSKVDLSDDALRIIYEREKETWRVPEKAHLAEILVSNGDNPARAARRAKEASDLIKGGAKFEAVVKDYSDGATKARGGDLGMVARGELTAEIDKAVFSLPVGTVSDPIATKFGWHLVKVIEKVPVSYKPFTDVKAQLLKREQETQFQKKLAEYLDKIKREAVIRVSPGGQAYYTAPVGALASMSALSSPGAAGGGAPSRLSSGASRQVSPFELAPTVGYRFGGTTSSTGNTYIENVNVPNTLSFGLTAEYALKPRGSLEFLWSHQDTELRANLTPLGVGLGLGADERLTHLNIDTFQIGGLWQTGEPLSRARLYFDLLIGVTLLTPAPEYATLTRLSASVGGGIKLYVSDHIGARFGMRWMPVYINSTNSEFSTCNPSYGCYTYYGTNYLSQGDATAALLMRF
jgi:peptidyl-prolyl cis-trans isomerase SurA